MPAFSADDGWRDKSRAVDARNYQRGRGRLALYVSLGLPTLIDI